MNRFIVTTVVLLGSLIGTAWAERVLEQSEGAYELALGETVLPGSEAGSVIFRACADCETTALRVTAQTTYFLERQQLPFAQFVQAAEQRMNAPGGGENTAVYVFYDLASMRVNRLVLDPLAVQQP